jgi:hypothetical protein
MVLMGTGSVGSKSSSGPILLEKNHRLSCDPPRLMECCTSPTMNVMPRLRYLNDKVARVTLYLWGAGSPVTLV